MISARLGSSPSILLLAPVRGLTSEVVAVLAALDAFAPARVGLGLSGDELRSLHDYFVASDADPVVPLTANETSEVRGLVRFGEVRVPNPSFVEVLRWGRSARSARRAARPGRRAHRIALRRAYRLFRARSPDGPGTPGCAPPSDPVDGG